MAAAIPSEVTPPKVTAAAAELGEALAALSSAAPSSEPPPAPRMGTGAEPSRPAAAAPSPAPDMEGTLRIEPGPRMGTSLTPPPAKPSVDAEGTLRIERGPQRGLGAKLPDEATMKKIKDIESTLPIIGDDKEGAS